MKDLLYLYVGTYGTKEKDRIHCFELNKITGECIRLWGIKGIENPSYLALNTQQNQLYAVLETDQFDQFNGGGVVPIQLFNNTVEIGEGISSKGGYPCHLLYDEDRNYIFVSNYKEGTLSMYQVLEDHHSLVHCCTKVHNGSGPNKNRQECSHAHFTGFAFEQGIYCVDLGSDTLYYYEIDKQKNCLLENEKKKIYLPKGSGPRHFVLGIKQRNLLYVICELSLEIMVIDLDTLAIAKEKNKETIILQKVSMLDKSEDKHQSTGSAIRIAEDGKFLYVSIRGWNSIVAYEVVDNGTLKEIQRIRTMGKDPRDFSFIKECLVVAYQSSDEIQLFKRDEKTGYLKERNKLMDCISPVCVLLREG